MGHLREKVEAELEQIERVLGELPEGHRIRRLSVLELAGTASLLSSVYHGMENVLKQGLLALGLGLPSGPAWHRDLLRSACEHGIVSVELRNRLAAYMAFRHFFTHAYGFQLDPRKLAPLARGVRAVSAAFEKEAKRMLRQPATRRPRSHVRLGGKRRAAQQLRRRG